MWWRSAVAAEPTTVAPRTVAQVLRERLATVYLPAGRTEPGPQADPIADPLVVAGVTLLQADLLERGYLAAPALVQGLEQLDVDTLTAHGTLLLADIDATLGADRPHVPLFRGFPASVPADARALWVQRVLALLAQQPEQPCVLCGRDGTVTAVSPCAHLICTDCFDTGDYSACPICRRRLDAGFVTAAPARPRGAKPPTLPERARVLTLGVDADDDAHLLIDGLLAQRTAPSPQDSDDLGVLLATREGDDPGWLPAELPSRVTKAMVLAWLLTGGLPEAVVQPVVTAHITTATDALRLMVALSGGDPGLVDPPRFAPVPRPTRRMVLTALNRLDPSYLIEDLGRHRRLWIHAAERLHPLEQVNAHPTAAVAFAVLRGTRLGTDRCANRLREEAVRIGLDIVDDRVVFRSHLSRIESVLAARDLDAVVGRLRARPGEFVRRLDQVLRLAAQEGPEATSAVLDAVAPVLVKVAPAVLVSALGELRGRGEAGQRRVFFPSGGEARVHVVPDDRPALPSDVVERVVTLLVGEMLRRAEQLGPVGVAVIDAALDRLVVPFGSRTASRVLVTLPRGSVVPLPAGRTLRLFLHWMEAKHEVDLDLSLALYDADWQHVATCDYTNPRVEGSAAIHSGDLTSAPAPLGASEFIDLDLAMLADSGVRHVVVVVFSYTNIAFAEIPDAFAGVMLRAGGPQTGPVFDPSAVEQRFDLTGQSRVSVPFVLDLERRTMRWLDVTKGVSGTYHDVNRHHDALAEVAESLGAYYDSGARVSLGEAARWQAAARAATVVIRGTDGISARFDRAPGESVVGFRHRIASAVDPVTDASTPPADLAFLYNGDAPVADGATVYALHPSESGSARVQLISAADVAGRLTPDDA